MTTQPPITLNLYFNGLWSEEYFGRLPDFSGIYAIYEGRFINGRVQLSHVLYIGQSENIRSRIAFHEKLSEFRENLRPDWKLYLSAAKVYKERARLRMEAAMIYHFQPIFNVDGSDWFQYGRTHLDIHDTLGLLSGEVVVENDPNRSILDPETLMFEA
ncbi:MAG: GIY-YIG nuclease family protein [Bacteroidia bacterium]|nr:GIY-YIG nuclease family protein [Bacteroidia bacterium]